MEFGQSKAGQSRNVRTEFFANDRLLGVSSESPAKLAWPDVSAGDYRVVAQATLGARVVRSAAATTITNTVNS